MNNLLNDHQRYHSLDFLRGIAVLGILVMNIQAFSMPWAAYSNPTVYGDFSGTDFHIWKYSHIFFEQKFMGIFSMLFGVGVLIFSNRVETREAHSGKRHYIRMAWLLVFGCLHAYFIWWGDILALYAVCGMFLYLMKDLSTKTLLITAFFLIGILSLIQWLQSFVFPFMTAEDIAEGIMPMWQPAQEVIQQEVKAFQGSWMENFSQRTELAAQLQGYSLFYAPKIMGMMLLGMVFYKTGFITGKRKARTYWLSFFVNSSLGLALSYYGTVQNVYHQFDWTYSLAIGVQYNYWGSIFSTIGYVSVFVLISKRFEKHTVHRWFSNVGRMAFTNYIFQSLICTWLIYGIGFGWFGLLDRKEQIMIVIFVWCLNLMGSSLWLRYFKQGPLEWLWRKATYGFSNPVDLKAPMKTHLDNALENASKKEASLD